jgi:hexulose-6-phosphate isomerase
MIVDRRTFITTAASLAAAGAPALAAASRALQPASQSTPTPPTSPNASKRTLKKAVMYGMIGDGKTVLEKFQILKDTGFDGVEMDSPSKIDPDEILSAQAKTGIKVHGLVDSVHWQFHLNNPEPDVRARGLAALEEALRDAKKFGSISILLVPAVVNADMPYDDAWNLSQEQIRKALPLARDCGVKIAIENVWNGFLLSPLEAARYVDDFNDPEVAFHFDIGNVINFGYPDQWVRILNKRIAKLHIKDFSRKKRDEEGLWKGFNVELGQGDAGWARVMHALDDIGYSTAPGGNWATAEVRGGDSARLKQISDQMDALFLM